VADRGRARTARQRDAVGLRAPVPRRLRRGAADARLHQVRDGDRSRRCRSRAGEDRVWVAAWNDDRSCVDRGVERLQIVCDYRSCVDRGVERRQIVCGSQRGTTTDRLRHVYTSLGNAVRIRLHVIASDDSETQRRATPRFLIHYQGLFSLIQSINQSILGGQLRWALCLSGNPPLCVLMLSIFSQLYFCIVENKPSLSLSIRLCVFTVRRRCR